MTEIEKFYYDLGVRRKETLEALAGATVRVKSKKGEHLCRAGEPLTSVWFHLSGITRGYVIGEQGNEKGVLGFGFRYGEPCLGAQGLEPYCTNYVQCVTDCVNLKLPAGKLIEILEADPEAAAIYSSLLVQEGKLAFESESALRLYDADKRYDWFLETYADIADELPQGEIASFLNITPQSFSRLKRQRKEREKEFSE